MTEDVEVVVDVPSWMSDSLDEIARRCEKSIDYVAGSLIAAEVVHTSQGGISLQ